MANLGRKGEIFVVRFRYLGKEFKKSLKVRQRSEAEAARKVVELTIHRLLTGQLAVAPGVEAGDFIVSGGTLREAAPPRKADKSIGEVVEAYLESQRTYLAVSTHRLVGYHLNHWMRHLGGTSRRSIRDVDHSELEAYLRKRVAAASETTAAKERRTLMQLFQWAVREGFVQDNPACRLTALKAEGERPPYRTLGEVQAILERGGLTDEQRLDLWECIYLQPSEIAELLTAVVRNMTYAESYVLHVLPAYTGMRRGEVMRLTWSDVDLEGGLIRARSLKQSRRQRETVRTIDLHPELLIPLKEWKAMNPEGQHVLLDPTTQSPLTSDQANRLFWSPMRGTQWCLDPRRNLFKVGFHTYRHSFVSNLAAQGVDQRIIDEFVGHSTESMRRRYRHLFPSSKQSAIRSFSLVASQSEEPDTGTENQ